MRHLTFCFSTAPSHQPQGEDTTALLVPLVNDVPVEHEQPTEQQKPEEIHSRYLQNTPETKATSPSLPLSSMGPLSNKQGDGSPLFLELQNNPLTSAPTSKSELTSKSNARTAPVKVNVTPPLAAPGRKALRSTGKRASNSDAPRCCPLERASSKLVLRADCKNRPLNRE